MIAVVFSGQGSQFVGMGKDLPIDLFNLSDQTLGYPLSNIIFEGSEADLTLTQNTQPALLTHGISLWNEVLKRTDLKPDYFAGHSLGEYTALVAGGGMRFVDAVLAVHNRGIFMQRAVPSGLGGMLAVLGASFDDIESVCKEVSNDGCVVEPANYNSLGQVVVSGHNEALRLFTEAMKLRVVKKIVPLAVSAPFHSSLMKSAGEEMKTYLLNVTFSDLNIPIINNVDADILTHADNLKDSLVRQVYSSVKWVQSVDKLISLGVNKFIEVGPGSVLTGLIKKINRDVTCVSISSIKDIDKLN